MTNLIKSHSFIVKNANGKDDFRIQLRAAYWHSIKSERKLRKVLLQSFEDSRKKGNVIYANALQKHYDNNNILYILHYYGLIAASERITKK